jgi:hypothetical protein
MKMISFAETESKGSPLKIRGRLMLHEEFSSRLQNMCNTLGFENVNFQESGYFSTLGSFSDTMQNCSERDAVIVLSCKVNYDPSWGGFCGHPQLLTRMKVGNDELCPAGFLAPFLQMYNSAQKQIYLNKTKQGRHLITLPKGLLKNDAESVENKFIIALNKVAEPDENGAIVPVSTYGSRFTYNLSTNLKKALDTQSYDWKPGRSKPIGQYLSDDMFFFTCVEQTLEQNNPFHSTLFPYLQQLVTHRTPHLRAVEIHLRQEFNRAVALLTAERQATFPKLMCLAGLVIDMTSFAGHEEKYFVPWKAYLDSVDGNGSEGCSLNQDDLFVRLMH